MKHAMGADGSDADRERNAVSKYRCFRVACCHITQDAWPYLIPASPHACIRTQSRRRRAPLPLPLIGSLKANLKRTAVNTVAWRHDDKPVYDRTLQRNSGGSRICWLILVQTETVLKMYQQVHIKLETKASPRRQCNAVPAGFVTQIPITRVDLITISIVTIRIFFAQLCGRFFCVLENFHHRFSIVVAPPTGGLTNATSDTTVEVKPTSKN